MTSCVCVCELLRYSIVLSTGSEHISRHNSQYACNTKTQGNKHEIFLLYFYYVKLITAQPFVKIQHLATIFEVVNKCTVQCRWDDHITQ